MKKVLAILGIILVTVFLFSFDGKEKKAIQPKSSQWMSVVNEINDSIALAKGKMIILTPHLEGLFVELYQLRPDLIDGTGGPNEEDMLLKWCWVYQCYCCSWTITKDCSFFHNFPSCCPHCSCSCGSWDCPCARIYVGDCSNCGV